MTTVEMLRECKRERRTEMVKALVNAGYSVNEIAVAFNLSESIVRSNLNDNTVKDDN